MGDIFGKQWSRPLTNILDSKNYVLLIENEFDPISSFKASKLGVL